MSRPAAPAPPSSRSGLRAAWARLDHRQRRVGAAVLLVLATMVLPWYSEETITREGPGSIVRTGGSVSGFAGMSFIEASLLVVLLGVLALIWGRGTQRRFSLPFPDGTLVCAAAGWMGLLIVYRLFARPSGVSSAQEHSLIGLNWGIFASLLAVGVLFAAGLDLRRHGPRNPVPGEPAPAPPGRYPDVDPATIVVRPRADEPPATRRSVWDDEPPTTVVPTPDPVEPPTRPAPAVPPDDPPTAVSPPVRRRPTPPTRSSDPDPGRETWPSRMRRAPRDPDDGPDRIS